MKFTGKISGISRDYATGKFLITFQSNEDISQGYENLKSVELLDVTADKHKKKRSLDANAYFHVLVGKIADAMIISKPRCKNILVGLKRNEKFSCRVISAYAGYFACKLHHSSPNFALRLLIRFVASPFVNVSFAIPFKA